MPQLASVMIHVFPSLEHSTDCVRKPADNFRTFVCVPYWHQKVRSLSAACRTHSVSVQTWPRHGMGCQPRHGRNTRILLQRICRRLFILELFVLWYSCNITYHFKEIFAYCDNFLYFAHRCAKRCTKILKLSFAVRTLPIACSKLGKTRTIADVRTAWLETAGFAIES